MLFQTLTVNPGAARALNSEGVASSRRLYSSSAGDGISNHVTRYLVYRKGGTAWLICVKICLVLISIFPNISSQLLESIVNNVNGQNVNASSVPSKSLVRPATADRWTQTDSDFSGAVTCQDRLSFPAEIRGLQLEDMLPEPGTEGTCAKLCSTPGLEEEDELGGEDQEKDLSWPSSIEKPIEPTAIGDLHRWAPQSGSCSRDDSCSDSASGRISMPETPSSPRCGPLTPILEGEAKQLCVGPPPSNSNHLPNNQSLHCFWLHDSLFPLVWL